MHKEVRWIHNLFIFHVFLLETHLSRYLSLSFVGKVS